MFTGIIEETGAVRELRGGALTIQAQAIFDGLRVGDSVAVNGVCLTVKSLAGNAFTADVMHEPLRRSSLGSLRPGSRVNLERAMPANGRFGGHIVSGHIDGTGVISNIERDGAAVWYTVRADSKILRYIVEKGSIAVDGISLTVAAVTKDYFKVSVIPHTAEVTTLSERKVGDAVNLENDPLGKYIEKLMGGTESDGITREYLAKYGY